jgi:cell division GTPase FtsZ
MIQVIGIGGTGENAVNYLKSKMTEHSPIAYLKVSPDQTINDIINDATKVVFIVGEIADHNASILMLGLANVGKTKDILTIFSTFLPFPHEVLDIQKKAALNMELLKQLIDALLPMSMKKLQQLYGNLPFKTAFQIVDDILLQLVLCTNELLNKSPCPERQNEVSTFFRTGGLNKIKATEPNSQENEVFNAFYWAMRDTKVWELME